MQDRFKFRIWLEYENEMISPEDEDADSICLFAYNQHGNLLKFVSNNEVIWARIGHTIYDEHIMQCTGLKDKNGNLIYEGDVVETWKFSTGITANKVVVWNNDRCGCRLIDISLYNRKILEYPQSMVNVTTMKILGNIYENPELLEEK